MKSSDQLAKGLFATAVVCLITVLIASLFGLTAPRFAPAAEVDIVASQSKGNSPLPGKFGMSTAIKVTAKAPLALASIKALWPNWLLATLLCLFCTIASWHRTQRISRTVFLSLGLALTTSVFHFTRVPSAIAFESCLIYAIFLCATQIRRRHVVEIICEAALVAWLASLSPQFLPIAIVFVAWSIARSSSLAGTMRLLHAIGLIAVTLFGVVAAYRKDFVHAPLVSWWSGMDGLLLSTGKGIFWYNPVLLLCFLLPSKHRFVGGLLVLTLVISTALRINWFVPVGWGPVRLFCAVPILYQLVAEGIERLGPGRKWWLAGIFTLSLGIQFLGATFASQVYLDVLGAVRTRSGAAGWTQERAVDSQFIPQFSPLRGQLWLLEHKLRHDSDLGKDAPFLFLLPDPLRLGDLYSRLEFDWWLPTALAKQPGWVVTLVGGMLFALAGLLGLGVLRQRLKT